MGTGIKWGRIKWGQLNGDRHYFYRLIHACPKENKMKLTHMTVSIFLAFVAILAFISVSCSQSSPPDQNQSSQSGAIAKEFFFRIDFPKPNADLKGTITTKGSHNYDTSQHIWIILSDGFGYYLQNPEVTLYAKTWEHSRVSLGGGIRSIIAVLVTDAGHREFQGKANRGEWGQFSSLPDGTKRLAAVPIINNR
jgi:hypothetical protein